VRELTAHHRDHITTTTRLMAANWDRLRLHCHDNEQQRGN